MYGIGAFNVTNNIPPSGAPFPSGSANNGLSVDAVTGKIVLGQDVGDVSNPAAFLNDREIPMAGFSFSFNDGGGRRFSIDNANNLYQLGDIDFNQNGFLLDINDATSSWSIGQPAAGATNVLIGDATGIVDLRYHDRNGAARLIIGEAAFGYSLLASPDLHTDVQLLNDANGNQANLNAQDGLGNSCTAGPDGSNGRFNITASNVASFMRFSPALTDHAAAAAGTLNNAPSAGNPTKWIAIDDNGVIRRIPTW